MCKKSSLQKIKTKNLRRCSEKVSCSACHLRILLSRGDGPWQPVLFAPTAMNVGVLYQQLYKRFEG